MPTTYKLRTQQVFLLEAGKTTVLLDWTAAHTLLASVKQQFETAEVIRVHAQCASLGSSMINNLPISRQEARSLITDLTEFING